LPAQRGEGGHPTVFLLPSFPERFKRQVGRLTAVVEVTPGQSLAEGLSTTGEMGGGVPEQALVIKSGRGLVVMTGCAHPGVVGMVAQVKASSGDPVHLVIGGFHLRSKTDAEMAVILDGFRRLGVARVAPCHCTGERAIARFAVEYGDGFVQAGVGRVIAIEQ
jgi:7,8-dihydropterin-6-yl-methyl-4-(beta-D-ribofuranosyl)aminobenzene 5'-phosphate synthase